MYRFTLPSYARPAIAPAPDHDWQQAERILEILNREQAAPAITPKSFGAPRPADLDAWLSRPLRESDYLRAYGIGPDDEFWSRYYDPVESRLGPGHGVDRRIWDRGPERPLDRAPLIDLFGNERAPAAHASSDETPRIVAVPPHRSDRDITEEILAKLAEDEGTDAQDGQADAPLGVSNLFGLIGSAQAQGRNRGNRPEITPAQQVHREVYGLLHRRLGAIEPNNPLLTTIQQHGYVPSREDVDLLWREWREAQDRVSRGEPPRPQGYLGPLPRQRGGETEYTIAGRAAHREKEEKWKERGYEIESELSEGRRRMDAILDRPDSAHVIEIKSNNPRSVERGTNQARSYADEYAREKNKPTSWELDLYDIVEVLKRLLPNNWR